MENKVNIQLLVESMTRCSGNCSGCGLSSPERMQSDFDMDLFIRNAKKANDYLKNLLNLYPIERIESFTLFLGQGDHFMLKDEEIPLFMQITSEIIPEELIHKTVVFITASAIGKMEHIKRKSSLFYNSSISKKLPFFIQTVFDPKKIHINSKFESIYINTILHFKQLCGMTELTINVGKDLLVMPPSDFHDWVKKYRFRHVEMNWVNNLNTHSMWENHQTIMLNWLKEWLTIYIKDWKKNKTQSYEINFLPFLSRHNKMSDLSTTDMILAIKEQLQLNMYIDANGNTIPSQMGLISNLTPLRERLSVIKLNQAPISPTKIMSEFIKNPLCGGCEFKNTCAYSGVYTWNKNNKSDNCPFGIKHFLTHVFQTIEEISLLQPKQTTTIFNKNPVQSTDLIQNNNATHRYFEKNINPALS